MAPKRALSPLLIFQTFQPVTVRRRLTFSVKRQARGSDESGRSEKEDKKRNEEKRGKEALEAGETRGKETRISSV